LSRETSRKRTINKTNFANFESHWQIILEIGMGLFSIVRVYRRADQSAISELTVIKCHPLFSKSSQKPIVEQSCKLTISRDFPRYAELALPVGGETRAGQILIADCGSLNCE
jgi:hypothetical protein